MTGNDVRDEWRAPLDDLRTLRESLREEEQRTSYWRQLVQAGSPSSAPRSRAATRAPTTWPAWKDCGTRRSRGTTRRPLHRLERGLIEAEVKLSAYRRALHQRIDACTAQLVDHYQRDPAQIMR